MTRFSKLNITISNQGKKKAKSTIEKEYQELKNSDTSENYQSQENTVHISTLHKSCHAGYAIVFDNIDLEIKRKDMTMANQNRDEHWVNHKIVFNRVSGNQLESEPPRQEITKVPNIKFLPSAKDYKQQRHNYIVLVSRILVRYFSSFSPLKEACIQHIKHKYVKEMTEKFEKVRKNHLCSLVFILYTLYDFYYYFYCFIL